MSEPEHDSKVTFAEPEHDSNVTVTFAASKTSGGHLDDEINEGKDVDLVAPSFNKSMKKSFINRSMKKKSITFSIRDAKKSSMVCSVRDARNMSSSLKDSRQFNRTNMILQSLVASTVEDGLLTAMIDVGSDDGDDDESQDEPLPTESEVLPYTLIILSLCQYFTSGLINCTPNVFSDYFQQRLNVSPGLYGMAFTVSKVGSLMASLISPVLIQRYGGLRPLLFMSVLFILGAFLFCLSYNQGDYYIFIIGLVILNLASVFNYLIASTVVGISITDKDSYRVVKMALATIMALGDIFGGFIFPHLGIAFSLTIFFVMSVVNVLVTIFSEIISVRMGFTPSYQQAKEDLKDINEDKSMNKSVSHCQQNISLSKRLSKWSRDFVQHITAFPEIYWLLVLESTLVAGFSVYVNFSIFGLTEIYGLSVVKANQIISTGKTMKLCLLIPSSLIMKKYKWFEKPVVLIVPILFTLACVPVLLHFSLWRAWLEYIILGFAIALSRLVSTSLIIPALLSEGKQELITTGSGHLMVFTSIWSAITNPLYYSIIEYTITWEGPWRTIEFHPGYLFNIGIGFIILIDSIFIFRHLPFGKPSPQPKAVVDENGSDDGKQSS